MNRPDHQSVPGFGVAVDDATETVWVTDAAADLFAGRGLFGALDPTSGRKLRSAVDRVTTSGSPTTSEVNLLTTEGDYRTYLMEIAPRPDGGAVMTGVDVSRYVDVAQTNLEQWVEAERTVEEAEGQLHGERSVLEILLGQIPGALWALDRDASVIQLAGTRLDVFGWADLGPGASMEQLLGEDRSTQGWQAHRDAMAGEPTSFEYHDPATGTVFQVRVEPRTDQYGIPDGCVGLALDITELRRAADRTRAALVRERAALVQLQDLDHRKRELLTAVSHEMRTPLTKLHTGALLLLRVLAEDDPAQAQPRGVAESMLRGSERLQKLLDDLTDVNELDTQRRSGGVEVELDEVVRPVVAAWAARTGRTVVDDLEQVTCPVAPEHVERLLGVLLDNVADHTPADTTTWVSLRAHEGHAGLTVADDGPGIPEDDRDQVVAPFAHGSNLREHAPGLGLGLSVADRLSRAYGGSLEVEERPGGGTLCRVSLPRSADTARHPTSARDEVAAALANSGAGEDLESVTRPLLEALQTLTGLSSTYLTSIDWGENTQHILYSLNSGDLEIAEDQRIDWADTVCRRSLESGQAYTDDVPGLWGDSPAGSQMGIQTYVSSAVVLPGGEVYGTLCGASSDRLPVSERTADLLQVFSRVIADVIARDRARQASEARALVAEGQVAARARFLAMAERSVQEPLDEVLELTGTLRAGGLADDRVPQVVEALTGAADRLSLHIEEVVDEARARVVASELQLEPLDLDVWLHDLGRELDGRSDAHPVRVETPAGLSATADVRALRIVVEHLVENAVKYSPEGEVTISAGTTPAGRTVISVRDRGPGLPPGVDVFDAFVRGDHPQVEGTGLGLHIVRSLVHAMGGDVAVEHREPGTEFRILLHR